ncbi:DUF5009 domain-containing protein [Weeksella virosa]|uniref:acyltransferase family protein n=1 Tax=Weeksella virosa TaxID=1014 RepID=UPI002554A889|nr:DUF5009 domain-containing protein [Weeksella virosa]MDK7674305.1 DUF5009 domain-containing protein [Weeksella virosa]
MKTTRYYSLDVFRGATIALMILVNNPGSWSYMFSPLQHASWHGCTPTDLVFPFFLFAVGNAMSFGMSHLKLQASNVFWKKIIKRTILIFAIGLFINWWPFLKWENNELVFRAWRESEENGVRIMGVLQRIAIANFFASTLAYYYRDRVVLKISILILLFYWALTFFLGGVDPYSLEGFIGTKIDVHLIGLAHMHKGEGVPFDPEGLYSTIPAISQILLGYLVGVYIQKQGDIRWFSRSLPASNLPIYRMLSGLFVLGAFALIMGYIWQLDFPYNKKIWSSSYVIHTTALAIFTIGCMVWFAEVLQMHPAWMRFFDVFGKNPLFIFVLSGLLPRLLQLIRIKDGFTETGEIRYLSPLSWFYENICAQIPGTPKIGSFFYSLVFLALFWGLAFLLDRKKIYIKV